MGVAQGTWGGDTLATDHGVLSHQKEEKKKKGQGEMKRCKLPAVKSGRSECAIHSLGGYVAL